MERWGSVTEYEVKWSEVTPSCPTLCNTMDCSPPGSLVHGIFQAWILEWVAISFSKGSSWPRDETQDSRIVGRCFTIWATREVSLNVTELNSKGKSKSLVQLFRVGSGKTGASQVAQMVKSLPPMQGTQVQSLGWEDPHRWVGRGNGKPLQNLYLENPHWQKSLVGYNPWDHKELDMTNWNNTHRIIAQRVN